MTVPLCMISDTEYKTNFHTQLKVLQQESAHTDATLNIGDFHICCHKIVLCAASPYFKSIFATGVENKKFNAVRLTGIDHNTLQLIVNYMYTSNISLTPGTVSAFTEAAKCLQLVSLQKVCELYASQYAQQAINHLGQYETISEPQTDNRKNLHELLPSSTETCTLSASSTAPGGMSLEDDVTQTPIPGPSQSAPPANGHLYQNQNNSESYLEVNQDHTEHAKLYVNELHDHHANPKIQFPSSQGFNCPAQTDRSLNDSEPVTAHTGCLDNQADSSDGHAAALQSDIDIAGGDTDLPKLTLKLDNHDSLNNDPVLVDESGQKKATNVEMKQELESVSLLPKRKACSRRAKYEHRCVKCTVVFSDATEYNDHQIECSKPKKRGRKNEKQKYPICEICHKEIKYSLAVHIRSHTGEKPFVCDICGKSFTQASNLKCHKIVHSGERPYSCGQCEKKFALAKNLKDHEKIHKGIKDYMCDLCSQTFTHALSLKIHMMCHTGEKPYACAQCKCTYRTAANLKEHTRRAHTNIRPFKCDICHKAFPWANDVRKHMRCHTRVHDFKCTICTASFHREDRFNRHMSWHNKAATPGDNIRLDIVESQQMLSGPSQPILEPTITAPASGMVTVQQTADATGMDAAQQTAESLIHVQILDHQQSSHVVAQNYSQSTLFPDSPSQGQSMW